MWLIGINSIAIGWCYSQQYCLASSSVGQADSFFYPYSNCTLLCYPWDLSGLWDYILGIDQCGRQGSVTDSGCPTRACWCLLEARLQSFYNKFRLRVCSFRCRRRRKTVVFIFVCQIKATFRFPSQLSYCSSAVALLPR